MVIVPSARVQTIFLPKFFYGEKDKDTFFLKMLNFVPLEIRSQLVHEYQEGKAEVTIKCLNGDVQVSILH